MYFQKPTNPLARKTMRYGRRRKPAAERFTTVFHQYISEKRFALVHQDDMPPESIVTVKNLRNRAKRRRKAA